LSFRFTSKDFENCRPNRKSIQELKNRFQTLETILLKKLPHEFDDFKKKKAHYVCRIAKRGGKLREHLWLGMANRRRYRNPRYGVQYQFEISRTTWNINGIWIEGTYNARSARLDAAGRLAERRQEFIKAMKRLGEGFELDIISREDEDWRKIPSQRTSDAVVDKLIDVLPRHDTYVHIGKPLYRKDIVNLKEDIVNEIVRTFRKLLPIYRLLTEGAAEPIRLKARRVPSTQAIHESSTWGMKTVMRFERSEKRKPKDVSQRTEGYDILSESKKGYTRYIEVKSRRGGSRVTLTENEFEASKEKGGQYFVYVVRGDGSIRIVQNPAQVCKIKEIPITAFEIVDWVRKSTVHNVKRS